ncbi:hypothetical protein Tco_1580800 [Tanacetum coccineum]
MSYGALHKLRMGLFERTPRANDSAGSVASIEESDHKSGVKHWWIIGGLGGGLTMILAIVAIFVCARSSICYGDGRRTSLKDHEDGHKFHILRTSSFWCRSGRLCCNSDDWRRINTIEESSDRHTNIPNVIATDVFDVEKPVVFAYEEVLSCTDFFFESNLLGHGTYGSVYYGLLRSCCQKDDCNENQRVHSKNESFVQSSSYKFGKDFEFQCLYDDVDAMPLDHTASYSFQVLTLFGFLLVKVDLIGL